MEYRILRSLCAALSSILFLAYKIDASNVSVAQSGTETFGWKEICQERSVKLTVYFKTYDSLAKKLREFSDSEEAKSECPEKFHASIEEFGHILVSDFYDDVCKRESLEVIHNFHLEHIAEDWRNKIPRNIRAHFIKLAQTIADKCLHESELAMLTAGRVRDNLPPSEFDLEILQFAFDNKKFKQFFNDFQKLETIDLPKPKKALLPENSVFRQAQEICAARLRPVYEHLIVPTFRLILAGYSTRPTVYNIHLFGEIEEFRCKAVSIERWYHIMQVCEVLKNLDFYIIPHDQKIGDINWGPLSDADAEKVANLRVDDSDEDLRMIDVSDLKRKKVTISKSIWNLSSLEEINRKFEKLDNNFSTNRVNVEYEKLERYTRFTVLFLSGVVAFT